MVSPNNMHILKIYLPLPNNNLLFSPKCKPGFSFRALKPHSDLNHGTIPKQI